MLLILNCGSQSIKWKIFNSETLKTERQGSRPVFNSKKYRDILIKELKKIKSQKNSVKKIGHRFVHGGGKFRNPVIVNSGILKKLEKFNKLAPLHNPFNVLGIKCAKKVFPETKQIAVFDTAFYGTLPEKAYTYPLPENLRKKYNIRRFGFHGTSHEFAAKEAAKRIKKPFNKLKIICCHLGGGASITAVKNGRAVDTSMGFTPLEGLVMMTRSGSIDPGIVLDLCEKFSVKRVDEILNKESGIKGISGEKEMLKLLQKFQKGNKKAKLALDIFTYSIQKYIGAYFVVLGGCDLLVFTGNIGSGLPITRNIICKNLDILKIAKIAVIEANEELAIAQKIKNL